MLMGEEIGAAEGLEKSTKTILDFLSNTNNDLLICADQYWPSVAMGIGIFRNAMFDLAKRKVQSRFITEITADNLHYCKDLMTIAEVRHLAGLRGNFAASQNEYIASATMKSLKLLPQVIYSNSKAIVEQHHFFFENLWNKAIPAKDKIDDIEKGISPEFVEVIKNPFEIQDVYLNLLKLSKSEIMLVLATTTAFIRERNMGLIQALENALSNNIKIRIITPIGNNVESEINGLRKGGNGVEFRHVEPSFDARINILVVDKKSSLIVELKDDAKQDFIEAVGSAIYSTSKPKVLSFVTIFECLWKQTDLYEKLKETDYLKEQYIKKLQHTDKIKDEFINVAAHELRTPTQSILTYASLLKYGVNKHEYVEAIERNAQRLDTLIKNILDVTKIEGNKMVLHKEDFILNDLLSLILEDYKAQLEKPPFLSKKIQLIYTFSNDEGKGQDIFAYGDKGRIAQVISNLLDNAIKFTEDEGTINVILKTTREGPEDKDFQADITIKDTGSGISEEIVPYLFTKFSTKSFQGTGLGLYISKNIVESHGGRMWAQNNKDGKGATFSFSIPISNIGPLQKHQGRGF
jgi:two-component system sensor histidine kinase VicK